jgi:hypothetical protein
MKAAPYGSILQAHFTRYNTSHSQKAKYFFLNTALMSRLVELPSSSSSTVRSQHFDYHVSYNIVNW